MKKSYTTPEMEIEKFTAQAAVTTSVPPDTEIEFPFALTEF